MHVDQQAGSPAQGPKQYWYAAHDGSPAHASDCATQLVLTHWAHDGVP